MNWSLVLDSDKSLLSSFFRKLLWIEYCPWTCNNMLNHPKLNVPRSICVLSRTLHDTLIILAEPAWLWDSQPRMATMLRLEKSKRIEFTPGRGTTRGQNALKWMGVYAKGSGTLDGINFHSFFRLWQLVLWMSYYNLLPIYSKGSWIIEEMLLRLAFVTKWCYILYCYYMLRDNVRN